MATVRMSRDLHEQFRTDLRGSDEQVGFFLADFDAGGRAFVAREWRAIPASGFELQSPFHVTLTDEAKGSVIRWAWDRGLCLIEAHSHREPDPAELSPSDLWGLSEWVPHLSWRLQGRPYAALVVAVEGVDGLAWVDGTGAPESVMSLDLDDGEVIRTTARTIGRLNARSRWNLEAAVGD